MPETSLAERLVAELATCKKEGEPYPVLLTDLAVRLGPHTKVGDVLRAVNSKPFAARAVVSVRGRGDSPVALVGDEAALAASPLTLEAALKAKAAKTPPPWTPAQLKGQLHKALQPKFLEFLARQVAKGELPSFVVSVKGRAVKLHHRDQELPPTRAARDALTLVRLLRDPGQPNGAAPLVTAAQLAAEAKLSPKALSAAAKEPAFTQAAFLAKCGTLGMLAALTEDVARVACSAQILTQLLSDRERSDAHAFSVRELIAKVGEPLKTAIAAHLSRHDLARDLPPGLACVEVAFKAGSQRYIVRLENVKSSAARPASMAPSYKPAAPGEFTAAFNEAFARLLPESGSRDHVSLVDLRPALASFSRDEFDAGLRQLRLAGLYTLRSVERAGTFTRQQQDAAIREFDDFLLHVSRGRS